MRNDQVISPISQNLESSGSCIQINNPIFFNKNFLQLLKLLSLLIVSQTMVYVLTSLYTRRLHLVGPWLVRVIPSRMLVEQISISLSVLQSSMAPLFLHSLTKQVEKIHQRTSRTSQCVTEPKVRFWMKSLQENPLTHIAISGKQTFVMLYLNPKFVCYNNWLYYPDF